MMLIMSVPALAIDTAAAVLSTSYLHFGQDSDFVFCINTHLTMGEDVAFQAHFLLLPDDASLRAMLPAMRLS